MDRYFYLSSDGPFRVKSVTSSTRSGKAVIRIELETDKLQELGYALENLMAVQAAQRAPKPKPTRLLALPSPEEGR